MYFYFFSPVFVDLTFYINNDVYVVVHGGLFEFVLKRGTNNNNTRNNVLLKR